MSFLRCCQQGTAQKVKAALQKSASINAVNEQGMTGLVRACRRSLWATANGVVKLLLSKRCVPRHFDNRGQNALHAACCYSSYVVVKMLLDVDPSLVNVAMADGVRGTDNSSNFTPLMKCCTRWSDEAVKIA